MILILKVFLGRRIEYDRKVFMRGLRKLVLVLALILPLTMASPQPAQANIITCTDCATWAEQVAEWAKTILQYAAEVQQWLEENFGSAAKLLAQAVQTQAQTTMAQAQIDGMRQAVLADHMASITGAGITGLNSNACTITEGAQEADEVKRVTAGLVASFEDYAAAGGGVSGDSNSNKFDSIEVNDLCKLGFLDMRVDPNTGLPTGRYGLKPKAGGCTDLTQQDQSYSKYIDADEKASSVLEPMQYPLPISDHWRKTKDGHVSFIGKNGGLASPAETVQGLGSEMDYAAAWKFCEHLRPVIPTPTNSSTPMNAADVHSIRVDRQSVALRSGAAVECFRSIAYRTSCPQRSENMIQNKTATSQLTDCYHAQLKLCLRLSSPRDQGGMALTFINGDPTYANALANCQTEGISRLMYDAIMANKCHDNNYVQTVLPSIFAGHADAVERVVNFDCPAAEAAFEAKLDLERSRLEDASESLAASLPSSDNSAEKAQK